MKDSTPLVSPAIRHVIHDAAAVLMVFAAILGAIGIICTLVVYALWKRDVSEAGVNQDHVEISAVATGILLVSALIFLILKKVTIRPYRPSVFTFKNEAKTYEGVIYFRVEELSGLFLTQEKSVLFAHPGDKVRLIFNDWDVGKQERELLSFFNMTDPVFIREEPESELQLLLAESVEEKAAAEEVTVATETEAEATSSSL